ncbi:MAG TPA: beta-propeller fold lactonase family protein [Terriglobales bacterium]|jgi:6-phosphogluconolactonase (cycloisomerase 2 family)|nr:beta-propeller fold lactonase family protein [Terriglobales bacterium]
MKLKSVWGLSVAAVSIGAMLSCSSSNPGGATGTGFIWIATEGDQQVRAFNINLSNGSIGQVGNSQPTGVSPVAMALSPDGTALFVANSSDGSITSYSVGSDGSLGAGHTTNTATSCTLPPPPCPGAPPPPTCGALPVSLAIDPAGKFLFVAAQGTFDQCDPTAGNSSSGGISTYAISGSNLTFNSAVQTEAPTDLTGTGPSAVRTSPTGNFLYVANQFSNTIQAFSYDASNGALLPLNTYASGSNPSDLAFSRCAGTTQGTASCPAADGNNLFVTNSGSNNVSIFTACIQPSTTCGAQGAAPDGSLVQLSTSPVAAGNSPVAIFVHPLLGFVYAVNSKSNNVTQYRYGSATGALTTLTPASVNAGANPLGGGVTSDGSYVFISNNNGSTMSVFSVGPGGKLAPATASTVTLAGQPAAILVR